jgi:hypothetical protein
VKEDLRMEVVMHKLASFLANKKGEENLKEYRAKVVQRNWVLAQVVEREVCAFQHVMHILVIFFA